MTRWIILFVFMCLTVSAEVKMVPPPKNLKDLGRTCRLASESVIVVSSQAGQTERAAAERLQTLITRRFKKRLEIVDEANTTVGGKQQILLGLPASHVRLNAALAKSSVSFSAEKLGSDGFLLEMIPAAAGDTVIIAGGGPRGVLYGQDAFFDLLERRDDGIVFPAVSVQDWPSIPWRGRPHSVLAHHLEPGSMDAYVRARLNFTDVRDNPHVRANLVYEARKASMGCPPGVPLDKERIAQHIANAHKHDFFVYGTVSCAVPRERFDQVLNTYRELLALGTDGLWISFDDSGAGGSPCEIIKHVLALGAEHGIKGRAVAITPPLKEYQTINLPLNREMAAVPGMADATWFFTRVPCAADAAMAKDIGLRRLPGWWHNLVNITAGFTHSGEVVAPLRVSNLPGYLDLQPLSSGWGQPKYDAIREAASHTDTVLLWGLCSGFPNEYELTALGYWAWNPKQHNWDDTRLAIYRHVYGAPAMDDARLFDDRMKALKSYYELSGRWNFVESPLWPWRLKRVEDRAQVLQRIAEMENIYARLVRNARQESALEPTRLERGYFEPMSASLRFAKKMAELEYPDYTYASFESDMLDLLESGKTGGVEGILAERRQKILSGLEQIRRELAELKAVDRHVDRWEQRLSGVKYWQALVDKRTADMQALFKKQMARPVQELLPYLSDATERDWRMIFDCYGNPPTGNVIAKFPSDQWLKEPASWRGVWGIGAYTTGTVQTVALVYPDGRPSAVGEYAEVTARIDVPPFKERLLLDVFVQDSRRDARYKQFRFLQLWADDSLIWSEDIALDRKDRAWVTVDITDKVQKEKEVRLRFRVVDRKPVGSHLTVAFVGPFQLRSE